jgi:hypothetical protein
MGFTLDCDLPSELIVEKDVGGHFEVWTASTKADVLETLPTGSRLFKDTEVRVDFKLQNNSFELANLEMALFLKRNPSEKLSSTGGIVISTGELKGVAVHSFKLQSNSYELTKISEKQAVLALRYGVGAAASTVATGDYSHKAAVTSITQSSDPTKLSWTAKYGESYVKPFKP